MVSSFSEGDWGFHAICLDVANAFTMGEGGMRCMVSRKSLCIKYELVLTFVLMCVDIIPSYYVQPCQIECAKHLVAAHC